MSDIVTAAIIAQTLKVSRVNETQVTMGLSASFSTVTTISGRGFVYMVLSQASTTDLRITVDGGTATTFTLNGTPAQSSLTTSGSAKPIIFGGLQFDSTLLVEAKGSGASTISIIWGQS